MTCIPGFSAYLTAMRRVDKLDGTLIRRIQEFPGLRGRVQLRHIVCLAPNLDGNVVRCLGYDMQNSIPARSRLSSDGQIGE